MQPDSPLTFLRRLLLALLPAALLLVAYMVMDPFKVIWTYADYYPSQASGGIALNPAFVATQTYRQQADDEHYNAFIFGNSRSIYYPVRDWQRCLPTDSLRPFHYDAASESLLGLWLKVRFLDRQQATLDHVLIVTDASMLAKTDCDHWHLCETPPALTGNRNLLTFHWLNFRAFLNPEYMLALFDYSLFHQLRPYMLRKHLLSEDLFRYDRRTNECDFLPTERLIEAGQYYTPERLAVFEGAQFPDSTSPSVIGPEQRLLLDSIAAVFQRHQTACQIVISPLYNQVRLHPADLATLSQIFGIDHVHDFSGPNRWNADLHNYYEISHYRPHVARQILEQIYPH